MSGSFTIVMDVPAELNATLEATIDLGLGPEAPLFGGAGALDSIGLVSLLVGVEQAIEDNSADPSASSTTGPSPRPGAPPVDPIPGGVRILARLERCLAPSTPR